MKRNLTLLLLFSLFQLSAQIPTGYYNGAENKNDAELKTAIHNIIKVQSVFSYDEVQDQLKYTDEDPNNTNNVILLYSGWSYPKSDYGGGATSWNKEHTWAKSQGNFGTSNGPGTDLHHLRPTDATVNSTRSSLYFDNGGSLYTDGSRYGGGDGNTHCYYDSDSWEPQDSVKGDVARMLFYMAVRYESEDMVDLELAEYSSASGLHGKLSTLLQWNRQDPVGTWEIRRNNRIYERQKNRNPFIDHPELAEYIWGNKMGTNWTLNPTTDPILYSPSTGSSVDFGTVNYQQSSSKTVFVQGSNLTGNLNISLSGANAAYFTLSMNTITPSEAQTGSNVNITYNPSEIGNHTATLTISGGGITTVTVNLTGNSVTCQNVSLSAPFSTTISPFTQYSVSGDQIWTWKSATYGVAMSGYVNPVNNPNEDWLISPVLDLSNVENVVLSFSHTINKGVVANMQTENTVYVSNNYSGGNPNTAAWTKLTIPTYPTGADWVFVNSGDVQIPAINCLSNTSIAFKYICTSSSSATWEIKNLSIAGVCKSTGVESVNKNITHKITVENRNISMFNLESEDVQVYDIYGKKVFAQKCVTGKVTVNTVPQGVYIIRAGNEVQKLIVK